MTAPEKLRETLWLLMVVLMLAASIMFTLVWLRQNLQQPQATITCMESGGQPCK
jgi:hypothetical protein